METVKESILIENLTHEDAEAIYGLVEAFGYPCNPDGLRRLLLSFASDEAFDGCGGDTDGDTDEDTDAPRGWERMAEDILSDPEKVAQVAANIGQAAKVVKGLFRKG